MSLQKAKSYTVDLDASPKDRWRTIIHDHIEGIRKAERYVDDLVSKSFWTRILANIVYAALEGYIKRNRLMYGEEISAISEQTGIRLGKVAALQFTYEFSAYCTSIATHEQDAPILARSLDWDFDFLRDLIIQVDFCIKGKPLFRASTFAGFVGILTGMRCHEYALSVNFRMSQERGIIHNLIAAIVRKWPIAFLLRDTLETKSSFNLAKYNLQSASLISPCFLTIVGKEKGQLFKMTKDPRPRYDIAPNEDWSKINYIVQCNHDDVNNHQNILFSNEREKTAKDGMKTEDSRSISGLLKVFKKEPIINPLTIHITTMCPKKNYMQTYVVPKTYVFSTFHTKNV